MNVKFEWNTGTSQFIYSILRVKTSCHTYFEHIFSKGTQITNNINIASSTVLKINNFFFFKGYIREHSL